MVNQGGSGVSDMLSAAVQAANGLLFNAFDGYETHVGPAHGFADGFGVVGVIFAAFAVGDDEFGVHQFDGVALLGEFSGPVLGGGAGFDTDQAGFQVGKEWQDFGAAHGVSRFCRVR